MEIKNLYYICLYNLINKMEEEGRLIAGKLDAEYLAKFEDIREELRESFNGAVKISEASVIRYLIQSYIESKSTKTC